MTTPRTSLRSEDSAPSGLLLAAALPIVWRAAEDFGLSVVESAAVCESVALALADAVAASREPGCSLAAEPFDALVQHLAAVECKRTRCLADHQPHRQVVIDLVSVDLCWGEAG